MKLHAFLLVVIVALSPSLPRLSHATDPPKTSVTLEGDPSAVFCVACTDRIIRIGVIPQGGFKVKLLPEVEEPVISEAAFEKMRSLSLQKAFKPSWVYSPDGTPYAIDINVAAEIRKPGTYSLNLNLQPRSAPSAARLNLQIIYPEADLEIPAKLMIHRTWLLGWQDTKQQLDLRETKGLAPLTDLHTQARGAVSGSLPVPGTLELKMKEGAFNAGTLMKDIEYDLKGDFPLGVTTGSIRFFADELKEPKTLEFEVRAQLSKWLLSVAIGLGLATSFLLRYVISNQIKLSEARIAANKVVEQIRDDIARYKDETLRPKLESQLKELLKIYRKESSTDIIAGTEKVSKEHVELVKLFDEGLKKAEKECKDWGLALRQRPLPKSIEALRSKMEDKVKTTPNLLKDGNACGLEVIFASLIETDGPSLRRQALEYQKFAKDLFKILSEHRHGLPAQVQTQFSDKLKTDPVSFDLIKSNSPVENSNDIKIILENIASEFYETAGNRLNELALSLELEWESIGELLKITDPRSGTGALNKAVTAFIQGLGSYDSSPIFDNIEETLNGLQAAWKKFFNAHTADSEVMNLVHQRTTATSSLQIPT